MGSGVAILVSNKLTSKTVNTHSTKNLSAIWTNINLGKYKPVIICCLCHPPGADNSKTQDYITDIACETWDTVFQAHDVHDKVDALHHTVNNIIDKHCPLQPIKIRSDKLPWMTETIAKLIRARETAHKKGCKTYKVIKALVQRRIRGSKRQFINDTLNKESDTKTWWTTVKKLTNQSKNSSAPENAIIDGIKLSSAKFSEKINDFYINVGGNALRAVSLLF